MSDLNVVGLTGRIVRDVELRYTADGKPVARFSVAVNGWKKEDVSFFICDAWEKKAEFISEHCTKGSLVAISGKMKQEKWKDKATGANRSAVKIIVNEISLLYKAKTEGESKPVEKPAAKPEQVKEAEEVFQDEMDGESEKIEQQCEESRIPF